MYRFWVFLHITGALLFLAAHGVSAAVAFRLLRERRPERIRALLDLSAASRPIMYVSFSILLAAGVIAGFLGRWWSKGWIWTALGLLVFLFVGAIPLAVPYYRRVRQAVSIEGDEVRAPPEELGSLLSSPRPIVIAAIETTGIVFILWLMVYKPY